MNLVEPIPEDNTGLREAVAAHDAALAARDAMTVRTGTPETIAAHRRVNATRAAVRAANTTSFELNRWQMAAYRRAMLRLGMTVANSCPEFPALPAGTTPGDLDVAAHPDRYEDREPKPEVIAYNEARKKALAWHTDPPRAIEAHKFATAHQGWLITPAEIFAALTVYRRGHSAKEVIDILHAADVSDLDLWNRWIDFMTRAQHQGGFSVW
ncbi:hypothetical protein [Streptomyces sp. NRRL S-350]|uniref:hypothetical protein n=1 Tax=Streptomyces sp. NRRL S-350 TaxID=1463902 RepID=UPI00131C748A|nr:hypothetical protein [Streptomyces sp. NRRL S-350]